MSVPAASFPPDSLTARFAARAARRQWRERWLGRGLRGLSLLLAVLLLALPLFLLFNARVDGAWRDALLPLLAGSFKAALCAMLVALPLGLGAAIWCARFATPGLRGLLKPIFELFEAVPAVVCSVEYRLAPEHPYPTPLEDCVAAYAWFLAHLDELRVDPARVAIGGTSAGGNLAVATCLVARDRGLPMPMFQWLEVPGLDLTLGSPSVRENAVGYGLSAENLAEYAGRYATPEQRSDPLVSPVLADDLSGLPPTVVLTADLDPVRDDGERLVKVIKYEVRNFSAWLRLDGIDTGAVS